MNPYPRKDAPRAATWNHEAVFATWDEFDTEIASLKKLIPRLAEYKGTLTSSPIRLLDWFSTVGKLADRVGRISTYVTMAMSVDSSDDTAKAKHGQAIGIMTALSGTTAFERPELMAAIRADPGQVEKWIDEEPDLEPYRRYLAALRRKAPFALSADVETVLGNLTGALSAPSQTLNELANSDMKFAQAYDSNGVSHPVGQGSFMAHYTQADRALRQGAWESFSDSYRSYQNTFAAGYLGVIKQSVFNVHERGYKSVLQERLEPTGLPVSVFHTLIDTFTENLSVWHRYWEAKRKLLNLDEMRPWDRWAPLTSGGPTVPFKTAVEWISTALEPMGSDYVDTLRDGTLHDRWVDWAPNSGKRQGAFSVPAYPGSYPFIMMTYNDTVFSMSTLAHELGHSMHHHYVNQSQPWVYNGLAAVWRSSSIAETASNFHQAMTRTWLRNEKGTDEALMMAVVGEAMTNYHRYCFIMPTLARFELEVTRRAEAGEPLNAPILGEIMVRLFSEGYGETLTDDPERTAVTWAQFQHLYRPFYTFQYAVGISAASIAADRINGGDRGAVERYLEMLRTGYSLPAIDVFSVGNIDMTTAEPMRAMFKRLDKLVTVIEERAG